MQIPNPKPDPPRTHAYIFNSDLFFVESALGSPDGRQLYDPALNMMSGI